MKTLKLLFAALCAIVVAACSSTKKNSKSNASATPSAPVSTTTATAVTTSTALAPVYMVSKSPDGVYKPGEEELAAIQVHYKDVTLAKLNEGYTIYRFGACAKCHGVSNIYRASEARWKEIIDNMAPRANLSEDEKDAVYKYVLSIKAMQPK